MKKAPCTPSSAAGRSIGADQNEGTGHCVCSMGLPTPVSRATPQSLARPFERST